MDEIAIMLEINKLKMKIQKYNCKISKLKRQIKDCENGVNELSEYEQKVKNSLEKEKSKWKLICENLTCIRFNTNNATKTAQLFNGEKYYSFNNEVSNNKKELNKEILDCEDKIKEHRNKIKNMEDEIQRLKNVVL